MARLGRQIQHACRAAQRAMLEQAIADRDARLRQLDEKAR
jgi:hypothetical protein